MKRTLVHMAVLAVLGARMRQPPALFGTVDYTMAAPQCSLCGSYLHTRSKCPLDKMLHIIRLGMRGQMDFHGRVKWGEPYVLCE